jgi:transcriptional regulator with XRE-family HTH domain
MSQFDLARAINRSEKNVGNWERGAHEPRGESVVAIAHATGHEIEFFYVEADAEDEEDEAALRREARELIAPFNDSMVEALLAVCRERVQARNGAAAGAAAERGGHADR